MKCKLKLETLKVESYEIDPKAPVFRGTIRAHDDSRTADCWPMYSLPNTNCTDCTCNADVCTF